MRNLSTVFFLFFSIIGIVLSRIAYTDCNKFYIPQNELCSSMPFVSILFTLFAVVFLGILIMEYPDKKVKDGSVIKKWKRT